MQEIWKDIEGYEGKYQVSDLGNVRSLNYKKLGVVKNLIPQKTPKGYLKIGFTINGKTKYLFIHRLVMETFKPREDMYLKTDKGAYVVQVDHVNDNKSDNRLENLQWLTGRKNYCKAINRKKFKSGLIKLINEV